MSTRSKKSGKAKGQLSTFTYYIPAPPSRKTGYREREFDKILTGIMQSGFEVKSLQTQSVKEGMFVVAILKAPSNKIAQLDLGQDIQEKFKLTHQHSSPDIIMDDDEEV